MSLCVATRAEVRLTRKITFNGRALTRGQLLKLKALEQSYKARLPDGRYWYDNRSGLMGLWNGPATAALPAGLGFGGVIPANASGGNTQVFVNGRELHPLDVARLQPVYPGRYWLEANGDWGLEGGAKLGNLIETQSASYRFSAPEPCAYFGKDPRYPGDRCDKSGYCIHPC